MKIPNGYRPLLTIANAKTVKGEKLGYLTGILYLAPANESGVIDVCPKATAGCRAACLYTAGRAKHMLQIRDARVAKTKLLASDRDLFLACLRYDIAKLVRKAKRLRMKPAVRINGTSDLPQIATMMAREFPSVQFYDYTKIPKPERRVMPNYWITFSYSGENLRDTMNALKSGVNVSVVYDVQRGQPLPATWNGYRVIDGDLHDLRFLDPAGVVVGLRAKGDAKGDTSGFVQPFKILS